jgi:hypothetical protein
MDADGAGVEFTITWPEFCEPGLGQRTLTTAHIVKLAYLIDGELITDDSNPRNRGRAGARLSRRRGVRHLPKKTLDEIRDAGDRALNLRVADPYLRYQMQGQGFTWSFFTHKDEQDLHVHGAPIVEIYGILEGEMEIWSKPYYYPGSKEGHIPTRSASEGSGAFPSLARRVNMQQHAELPCRGNTSGAPRPGATAS